jgi:hypothetical protein
LDHLLPFMALIGIEITNSVAALVIASGVAIYSEVYLLLRKFDEALAKGHVRFGEEVVMRGGRL